MKDEFLKDAAKDGIRVLVVFEDRIVKETFLGNKETNSYLSYHYQIDAPYKEGVYRVCVAPSDSLFANAAKEMEKKGESNLFGKIF